MATVTNTISIAYSFFGSVSRSVMIRYGLNPGISNDVAVRYDMPATVPLSRTVSFLYNLIDQTVVQHASTCTVEVGGVEIDIISLAIEVEEGSYCMSCEINVATKESWALCTSGASITATINGIEYGFRVDSYGRSRQYGMIIYNVKSRSHTCQLDFPLADAVSFTNSATTANTLCASLCSACGVALTWNIIDWPLAAGLIVAEAESPLSIINSIAAAAGAVLQSSADGETLIVQYKYQGGTAERIFTDELDILNWVETGYKNRGYNCVRIADRSIVSEDESAYIYIELDDERNGGRTAFALTDTIYFRVYSSADYDMYTTAGSLTRIAEDETADAEPSVMLFDGEESPTTSRPITTIGETTWYGTDLGEVTKLGVSELVAAAASAIALGIAKVGYTATYDVWRLVPPAGASGEYYIYVKAQQEGD